jgi:hypothetical protein
MTDPPLSAYRLSRGRHNLPREQVEESQRWRLLVAALRAPVHQPLEIELAGRIDSVRGAIRATFQTVPDARSGTSASPCSVATRATSSIRGTSALPEPSRGSNTAPRAGGASTSRCGRRPPAASASGPNGHATRAGRYP